MSRYYHNDIVAEIQSRLDIVDLVSETINLTRKGNRYWGRCPFHDEKTASFCVTPGKNMFYCFGCNTGGDIFSFLMKRDKLDFAEALEILAAKAGIEQVKTVSAGEVDRKKRMAAINLSVAEYYHQCLTKTGNYAGKYFAGRNINQDTLNTFKLGYADEAWNSLESYMTKRGFSSRDLSLVGLIKKSDKTNNYFDLFRNRIIFPIFTYNGDIVGFGGRALDDTMPKYLNSPESEIFSKRKNLYGLWQGKESIRQNNQIILVEGYMDCIKLHQYGICNVVASLGTAFTDEQARLIKRYAEEVIILYDGDEAGQRETLKVIDVLMKENVKIDVITLPGLKDPDEFLDLYGKEDFLHFLKNNKVNYIEFKLNRYIKEIEPLHVEDKILIVNKLQDDIKYIESELKKDYLVKLIAQKLKIEENVIYREIAINRNLRLTEGIKRNKKQIIRDNNYYGKYALEEKILAAAISDKNIFQKLDDWKAFDLYTDADLKQLAYILKNYKDASEFEIEQIVREKGLENLWARLMLSLEEAPVKEYEINDFLRMVIKNRSQKQWLNLHKQLNHIGQNGNFDTMLNFVINLNTVINNSQEGGAK